MTYSNNPYYIIHRDKYLAYSKNYYSNNKEKYHNYYMENKDKIINYQKSYNKVYYMRNDMRNGQKRDKEVKKKNVKFFLLIEERPITIIF